MIQRRLVKDDVAGLQIAVLAEGRIIWSRGFGFADIEQGIEVAPYTVFRAASVSKLFTATLFLQQIDAGRIGLDDDVNAYLDSEHRLRDQQGREVRVTPRQLLTHTSGLPITWLTWPQIHAGLLGGPQPDLAQLLLHPTLTHPPGERIVYANSGYWMLGWLASRLAPADFADLADRDLLVPLGMTSSSFRPQPALMGRQAIPYAGVHGAYGEMPGPRALPVNPAASLLTTAEDLTRFARMILDGGVVDGRRVLSASLVQQMQQLQARQDPALDVGYGLGFGVSDFRGRRMIAHDGYDPGVASRLTLLPEDGIAVAILANSTSSAAVGRITGRVLSALTNLPAPAPEPRPLPASAGEWVGRYRAVDVMPPWLSWAERFSQLVLQTVDGELRLSGGVAFGFQTEVDGSLEPTDQEDLYRFRGAPWNGQRVVFRRAEDGSRRMYVGILELRRVPFYAETPIVLAATLIVAAVYASLLVRRRRRRP